MENAPRTVSVDELLERFWARVVVEESTIHRRISQIRQALGDSARNPSYIATVPKRGYRIVADIEHMADIPEPIEIHDEARVEARVKEQLEEVEWPFVISAFESRGDGDVESIAQDLTQDLMGVLPVRFKHLKVRLGEPSNHPREIALGGTVRQRGPDVRVIVQIAHQGRNVWTKSFERSGENFWQVQDHLVYQIVGELEEGLTPCFYEYYKDVLDDDLDVVGLCSRCRVLRFKVVDKASRDRILRLTRRIVAIAPDFFGGHLWLAATLDYVIASMMTRHPQELMQEAIVHVDAALALAPNDPIGLNVGSILHRRYGLESLGLKLGERCTAIMGAPQEGHYTALIQAQRIDEMLALAEQDHSRSISIDLPVDYAVMMGHTLKGDLDRALASAEELVGVSPEWKFSWVALANALALNDRFEEAQKVLDQVYRKIPGWTIELQENAARLMWRNDPKIVDALCGGIKQLS